MIHRFGDGRRAMGDWATGDGGTEGLRDWETEGLRDWGTEGMRE